MKFTIPGIPQAKARVRLTKSGFAYTPKETKNYEVFVKECFINAYPEYTRLEGLIEVNIKCYFPRPKAHYRTGKFSNELKEKAPTFHTNTPDLDNVVKSVLDGVNKIAFVDDSQVYKLSAIKGYTNGNPRVEVEIIGE